MTQCGDFPEAVLGWNVTPTKKFDGGTYTVNVSIEDHNSGEVATEQFQFGVV